MSLCENRSNEFAYPGIYQAAKLGDLFYAHREEVIIDEVLVNCEIIRGKSPAPAGSGGSGGSEFRFLFFCTTKT
jgi:hypothetical protein